MKWKGQAKAYINIHLYSDKTTGMWGLLLNGSNITIIIKCPVQLEYDQEHKDKWC